MPDEKNSAPMFCKHCGAEAGAYLVYDPSDFGVYTCMLCGQEHYMPEENAVSVEMNKVSRSEFHDLMVL